jgi:hypothetical protein
MNWDDVAEMVRQWKSPDVWLSIGGDWPRHGETYSNEFTPPHVLLPQLPSLWRAEQTSCLQT